MLAYASTGPREEDRLSWFTYADATPKCRDTATICRDLLISFVVSCAVRVAQIRELVNVRCVARNVMSQLQELRNMQNRLSMTGQEFLRWLEQSSKDALRKSSLGLQLVAMLAEIMDVNPELLKRAIEGRANLSSDSAARFGVPAEPQG